LYFKENYINISDPIAVKKALQKISISFHFNPETTNNETYLNGLNVEDEIRKMYVSQSVSEVSALAEVRTSMVAIQKKLGKKKCVVMDGRDICTMVFPDAELKIFMEADIFIRAQRRQFEYLQKDQAVGLEEIIENFKKRDHLDSTRKESPLVKASDAVVMDTSYLTFDEQVDHAIQLAMAKMVEQQNVKH